MPKFPPGVTNPLREDLDFAEYKAVAMACDSGATLPAAPVIGQWFLHTPAGRQILCQYNGADWKPIIGISSTVEVLYVDGTLGTDNLNYGHGPGADAFASIQYALDSLPRNAQSAHIYIAAGTYTEDLWVHHKNFQVRFQGSLSTVASLVATGGSRGDGLAPPNVTGAFAANAHDNKLIKFTSGANDGLYRIVSLTTATHLYLTGRTLNAHPVNTDTYEICDWGTIIDGNCNMFNMWHMAWYDVAFTTNVGTRSIVLWSMPYYSFDRCKVTVNAGIDWGLFIAFSSGTLTYCLCRVTSGTGVAILLEDLANLELVGGNKLLGYGTAAGEGIKIRQGATLSTFYYGNEIANLKSGIVAIDSGIACLNNIATETKNYIHGCRHGLYAWHSSRITRAATTGTVYGKKLDGTADANTDDSYTEIKSYSWVGVDTPDFQLDAHAPRHGYLGADELSLIYPIGLGAVPVINKHFADISGFTEGHSGGSFTPHLARGTIFSGATNGDYGRIYTTLGFYHAYAVYGYTLGTKISIRQAANQLMYIGWFETTTPGTNQMHYAFMIEDNNLYAIAGVDAANKQQSGSLATWVTTNDYFLGLVDGASAIDFYVNHVKVFSVTTVAHRPTAALLYLIYYIETNENANKQCFLHPFNLFAAHAY